MPSATVSENFDRMFAAYHTRWRVLLWLLPLAALLDLFLSLMNLPSAATHGMAPPEPVSEAGPRSVLNVPGQFMILDPSGRFLINSVINKPVFVNGDAAWSLITQLSNSDVELYLSDRASRGFNYIVCVAADNYYQSHAPKDYYGDAPFDGSDFTRENSKYWMHVDYVIQRAAAYGITVALDPAFVGLTSPGGYLASYRNSSDAVVTAYGAFLGQRFKNAPNLIWALGGDVDPQTGVLPKLTDLANGIRSMDSVHLIIAEGQPQFSALDTFTGANWMDLNWLYFHTTNVPPGTAKNYSRSPWIPPLQGEGWYENEHSMTPLQVREQGYWAVLSGSYLGNAGFGNNPTWYFNGGPDAKPGEPAWQSQLASPGSTAEMYLGRLFRSREHWKLVPDVNHSVLTAGYDSRDLYSSLRESLRSFLYRAPYRLGSAPAVAARTSDGQTIIAYIPTGNAATITVNMSMIQDSGSRAKCWWFNPRNGSNQLIGIFATSATRKFTPPDTDDWILVIDSEAAHLSAPGARNL